MRTKTGAHRVGWFIGMIEIGYRGRHASAGAPPTSRQLVAPLVGIVLAGSLLVVSTFAPEPWPADACWLRPDMVRYGVCWWDGER